MAHHHLFIGIKIKTDRNRLFGELEAYMSFVDPNNINGIFEATTEEFMNLNTLIAEICDWFYKRHGDPDCEEDAESIIKCYGNKNFNNILNIDQKNIETITVCSTMEYWDEPYGTSLLVYDCKSQKLRIQNVHGFDEGAIEENFGDDLLTEYRED